MDALSPGGRPTALQPVAAGAKAYSKSANGRPGAPGGPADTRLDSPDAPDAATIVRLSDEARMLAAAGERPGGGASTAAPVVTTKTGDEGSRGSVSPAEHAALLERFVQVQTPRPEARLIDAHA